MRILVSAASRHGATADIAKVIGDTLAEAGHEVVLLPPDAVAGAGGYDALIVGSGVYLGHWLDSARALVERLGVDLAGRPVWLFSSGPVGDPPRPQEDPVDLPDLIATTGARGHHLFPGLVDRSRLGLGERVILTAVRAPEGDYRPWDEIRAWAAEIAAELPQSGG
jgi:menaquinone-dependent protoporphyrinogen oxidase